MKLGLSKSQVKIHFLRQICKLFITLGLNILRLLWLQVFFEVNIISIDVIYIKNNKIPIFKM
jgi:hypothetical protein